MLEIDRINITIVGVGYVGLVTGVCFSEFGFDVTCVDNVVAKIDLLNNGGIPIYEPGLSNMLAKNKKSGRIKFTTSIPESVSNANVIVIAVGTPSNPDGSANLDYVYSAANEIAEHVRDEAVLVVKSTVPVGTTKHVKEILHQHRKKTCVAFNPEFLREGAAIDDFMHPDRVILGIDDISTKDILMRLYRPLYVFNTPIVFTNLESAELCKYASNAFLALKITFINQMADLCEKCGADVNDVALAMGLDSRIGNKFLQAGPGYGGSCFPKDTSALADFAKKEYGVDLGLVNETVKSNNQRKLEMVDRIMNICNGVAGKKLTILGVTFKANTDDMRASPSLDIIPRLLENKASITVYDPSNSSEAKRLLHDVTWSEDIYQACDGSDAIVIITDWNEFKAINVESLCQNMKDRVIIDLRNIFNPDEVRSEGIKYYSFGRH